MTPLKIHMLLDIYALAYPEKDCEYWNTPAGKDALEEFYDLWLIYSEFDVTRHREITKLTPKGLVYVEKLMSIPLPIQKWGYDD